VQALQQLAGPSAESGSVMVQALKAARDGPSAEGSSVKVQALKAARWSKRRRQLGVER